MSRNKVATTGHLQTSRAGALSCYKNFVIDQRPGFIIGQHHEEMFSAIDDLMSGEINILLISMPPRHGKTEAITRTLPGYIFAINPATEILILSGRGELAEGFARDIKALMSSHRYQKFGKNCGLKTASTRNLETFGGGKLLATHLAGATGEGGHMIIVDDPVPNSSFCDNDANLEKLYRSFTSDIMSRQQPMTGGVMPPIIIISTRWHSDDLTGRLLEQLKGDGLPGRKWRELSYQAINDRGDALWPEMMPKIRLDGMKRLMTERDWNCLYQQNPEYKSGALLDVNSIKRYSHLPAGMTIYGASDYALSTEENSTTRDETCHVVFGVDMHTNIYVVKLWTGMVNSVDGVAEMLDLMEQFRPIVWFGEKGIIRQALEPYIKIDMLQRALWTRLEWIGNAGTKAERAETLRNVIASGRLFLPAGEASSLKIIEQFRTFGSTKRSKDDIVDAFSLFCRGLRHVNAPAINHMAGFYEETDDEGGYSWMS